MSALRSENPFTKAFWFGSIDPRPLALFRITFGLTLLHDLFNFTRDFRAFLTDDGFLPRIALRDDWTTWGLFDFVGSPVAVALVYALGVAAVIAFTVGVRTRTATVATWVFLISLHHRNYFVTDGGDDLARIMIFWGMFCDLGARWSVDSWRSKTVITDVPSFGPRLMQLHIAILYLCAGRLKLRQHWLTNDVIFETLQLDGFVRPPGTLLMSFPAVCRLLGRSVCLMELAFPFVAFSPVRRIQTRALAILFGFLVQFGILVTMRVGIFTELMLASNVLWLQPEWLDRAEKWLGQKREAAAFLARGTIGAPSGGRLVLTIALALQFIVAVWDPFLGSRLRLPQVVFHERDFLSIVQPVGLFDVIYDVPHWTAPGVLTDGTPVDVLSLVAPEARPREPAYIFSRWYKFSCKAREHAYRFPELGSYLCRAHDERYPGPKLASFTLTIEAIHPSLPGEPPKEPFPVQTWHQECR